jgi:carboxymethylenebutenolidase
MGHAITLACADGVTINAWRAEPAGKPKGGLVVLQEIFGVNAHIRGVADRFAEAGYLVIAPAIFDRVQPHVDFGYDPNTMKQGMEIAGKMKRGETMLDIAAAVMEAARGGRVGITGFCLGGTLAYLAGCFVPGLSAAVGYYGGGIARALPLAPKVPLMLHFGEQDASIPMADITKIRAACPGAQVFTYPTAGHAFNRDGNAAYDAPSAKLAMERTLVFLGEHCGI